MNLSKLRELVRAFFSFSASESRGVLMLLPLLVVAGVIIVAVNRPDIEQSFPLLADELIDTESQPSDALADRVWQDRKDEKPTSALFAFDPNTIDYRGLRKLGFSRQSAAALINYRTKYKKVFELPTDFAACYQVTDSIFDRLEPYIVIGSRFKSVANKRPDKVELPSRNAIALFEFDPNTLDSAGFRRLGFSSRQTEVVINYRAMRKGFRSIEEFGECYSVADRIDELRPYIVLSAVTELRRTEKPELNNASVEDLVKVRGIGNLTAERIVAYRKRLGGFYDIRQLTEVEGVNEKNFELFSKEILIDNSKISKIDINFASAEIMENHPYMSGLIIRKVLKYKQLEGGLRSIEEMIKGKILSEADAEKLSHYLVFTQFTPE